MAITSVKVVVSPVDNLLTIYSDTYRIYEGITGPTRPQVSLFPVMFPWERCKGKLLSLLLGGQNDPPTPMIQFGHYLFFQLENVRWGKKSHLYGGSEPNLKHPGKTVLKKESTTQTCQSITPAYCQNKLLVPIFSKYIISV